MIYLDNAATTYPKPECVYEALDDANRNLAFNSGRGSYDEAKKVSDIIQNTRAKVASFINLESESVSFESSATEALNIIINGLVLKEGDNVYVSPFEHNAVIRPLYNLKEKERINIRLLPFDEVTWEIDEEKMCDMFSVYKPKACILSHISNVTGYILPVGIIFEQSVKYNCINILDCAQSYGIINPSTKYVDFIVFAGHKSLYASFGIAGFINVGNIRLNISKSGGTGSDSLNVKMPENGFERYESGSMNSVAIAGLNTSIDWLLTHSVYENEKKLTDYLIKRLLCLDKIHVYVPTTNSVFGIVSINVEGYTAEDVGNILYNEYGICVRTGYHCCPGIHDFIKSKEYYGTVRISIGAFTTTEEIDQLCDALSTL